MMADKTEFDDDLDFISKSLKELNEMVENRKKASLPDKEKAVEQEENKQNNEAEEGFTEAEKEAVKTLAEIDKIVSKYKGDPDFEALMTLANEHRLMELSDALANLEIEQKTFNEKLEQNPLGFIAYYRQRLEVSITYLYDMLQDLEADSSIGQFGQRLPRLFRNIREKYSEEELPTDINELVNAGNDINKLVSATVQLSLKLWAAHDLGLYLLITLSDKRNSLIDEINQLKSERVQIEEDLNKRKAEIEEEISKTQQQLNDLQQKREELKVEIDSLMEQLRAISTAKAEKESSKDEESEGTKAKEEEKERMQRNNKEESTDREEASQEEDSDDEEDRILDQDEEVRKLI